MPFDWILFDLDDTLLEFKAPANEALHASFNQFEIKLDDSTKEVYHRINHSVWRAFERNEISVDILPVRRMELFLNEIKRTDVDPGGFNDFYLDDLAKRSRYYPETEGVLQQLQNRFQLAIITNGLSRVQRYRWSNTNLPDYFSHIFISEEIGSPKPNKYFFDYVHGSLERPNRERVLVVGDNPVSDIEGANNYGYKSCFVERGYESLLHQKADFVIQDLNGLLDIVND